MQKTILGAAVASALAASSAGIVSTTEAGGAHVFLDVDRGLTEPLSDAELEQKIEAAKPTAPRITKEHIQSLIVDETYTVLEGTRTTVCRLQLANGFCVVGVNNGPVSAANFSQEIGCEYAYKAAVDQIWPLEGYLLAERLFAGDVYLEKVGKLRDLVAVQTDPGNAGAGEYMRGMANGLLVALSVFTGQEPDFVPAPARREGATHVANAVAVTALKIVDVKGNTEDGDDLPTGHARLVLIDGTNYVVGADMTARYWPLVGDYLVEAEDGYAYLNPAAVFERKYSAIG